jgi:hypothetical protein
MCNYLWSQQGSTVINIAFNTDKKVDHVNVDYSDIVYTTIKDRAADLNHAGPLTHREVYKKILKKIINDR